MQVKTGELRNHLSRYLKQLAQTGESMTILDRNRPVARIVPLRAKKKHADVSWEKEKAKLLARAKKLGVKITLTANRPKSMKDFLAPRPAPDGRTGTNSVIEMRHEKDY